MIVFGLDPGATSGWCMYDTDARRVVAAGKFPGYDVQDIKGPAGKVILPDAVVIERPRGQGPTRPQLVDCGIVFGYLLRWAESKWPNVHWLYRLDVKKTLTDATLGEVRVVNDATAWAALRLLHGGEGADKKPTKKHAGGPIGGVTSHERAALAVAVAWALREGVTC